MTISTSTSDPAGTGPDTGPVAGPVSPLVTGASRRSRHARRGLATAGVLTMAALMLIGCSKTEAATDGVATLDTGVTTGTAAPTGSSATDEAKLRDYAKCMRDNGVTNFPDPKVDANGRIDPGGFRNSGVDRSSQQYQDADKACASKRQGVTFGPNRDPATQQKIQDAALKYAQCLRDKGLTVKDPDFSQGPGGGAPGGGAPGGGTGGAPGAGQGTPPAGGGGNRNGRFSRLFGLDENDPAVKAAEDACQPIFQQALTDAGITPPGGGAGGGAPAAPAGQ